MPLAPGTPAPDFTLKTLADDGVVDVTLSDSRGKKVVLLFFPAAFTHVCTKEMCDATGFEDFGGEDVVVYGISTDAPFAQQAWAKEHKLGITLLSDYEKRVIEAYDVVWPDFIGLGPSAARASFVIDREGTVVYSEQTASLLDAPDFDAIRAALANTP